MVCDGGEKMRGGWCSGAAAAVWTSPLVRRGGRSAVVRRHEEVRRRLWRLEGEEEN